MSIDAIILLGKALRTGFLTDSEAARLDAYGPRIEPKEGGNRNALAHAAKKLARRPRTIPVLDSDWSPCLGPESFSPLYGGWWAAALSVLLEDGWWDAVGRTWLTAHALAAVPAPRVIHLVTPHGTSQRTLTGGASWRWGDAPMSIMPGPRFLWSDPLNASTLIQRAIIHPLLGLAAGRSGVTITDWTHDNYGTPLAAILGRRVRKPAAWGTVALGRGGAALIDRLPPLPRGRWVRYQWYADDTVAVGTSPWGCSTRGPVPLAVYRDRSVRYYTDARPLGGGRWSQSEARWDGRWQVGGDMELFSLGEPEIQVLWDHHGAVRLGKNPPTPPPDDPRVLQALGLLDAALVGGRLEVPARTCAEVLRRCIRGDRPGALRGASNLTALLERIM